MKNLKNNVQLIGHIGQTPELKSFESGTKMMRLRMATNEAYKNSTGTVIKDTQWHNLVVWGKQAETMAGLVKKGQHIAVEGKLVTRTYDAAEEKKNSVTEIHINGFQLLGKKAG